jgi:hypothetical protein
VTDATESAPPAPLSVATDLTLTVDGVELTVESTGERLFAEVESLADAVRVARALGGVPDGPADRLATLLRTTDLTLEVRVRDRTVAVVGADARPGAFSRGLGVDPVEVRLGGVLGAVGRELSAVRRALEDVGG